MNIKLTKDQQIKILRSDDIYKIMQQILLRENKIDRDREHFWTISLNTANKVLNIELVSLGTVNRTLVEPMEVFSVPLQKRAVKIILVHNHPSGELKPSENDRDVTDNLIQAGKIMNVPVLDHLIISEKSFYSFKDSGLLEELQRSLKYVPLYEVKKRYHEYGKKAGKKEGLEEGNLEGEKRKAVEMARVMKQNGEPIEKIVTYTGLSKSSISKLKVD